MSVPGGVPRWIPAAAAAELAGHAGAAVVRIVVRAGAGSLRDLGSYLLLADRMYGRLRTGGLRRYAQLGGEQLHVAWETDGGRLALDLREPVDAAHGWRMALLWVALELLPEVVGDEVAVPWAAARRRMAESGERDEPQVTLFAGEHQDLRARAAERPALAALSKQARHALVEAVQDLYAEDSELLPASIRFARERVAEVRLGS